MSEPQRNLTEDALEVVEGRAHEKLEGSVPEMASEARRPRACPELVEDPPSGRLVDILGCGIYCGTDCTYASRPDRSR